MVKIDELRRALRNGTQEDALSEHPDAPRALRRYKVSASGSDALLQFGRHRGLSLKNVQKADPAYLDQLLRTDIDKELKDLIRDVQLHEKLAKAANEQADAAAKLLASVAEIDAAGEKTLDKFRDKTARAALTAKEFRDGKTKIPEAELEELFEAVDDHVAADPEGYKRRRAARKKWLKR